MAMGRQQIHPPKGEDGSNLRKLSVFRIRLNRGGYDAKGTYWGVGLPLYCVCDGYGNLDYTIRAPDRAKAKERVLERYPKARFWQ